MLFTSSSKLLSVSALLLPALLASASPHSLSERADYSVAFFECDLKYNADCQPSETSKTLLLDALQHEKTAFVVVGGWGEATEATAESTASLRQAVKWKNSNKATLAWGMDGKNPPTYYVIFDDNYYSSSDGSDETVKGK